MRTLWVYARRSVSKLPRGQEDYHSLLYRICQYDSYTTARHGTPSHTVSSGKATKSPGLAPPSPLSRSDQPLICPPRGSGSGGGADVPFDLSSACSPVHIGILLPIPRRGRSSLELRAVAGRRSPEPQPASRAGEASRQHGTLDCGVTVRGGDVNYDAAPASCRCRCCSRAQPTQGPQSEIVPLRLVLNAMPCVPQAVAVAASLGSCPEFEA